MRQNYLAIIRKADLVDLFKYGEFHIRTAVLFDGVLSKENSDLFKAVTAGMNPFEYSFEYVLIHFVSDEEPSYFKVSIEDLKRVYAFDQEAKNEFEGSLDPRLEIKVSPWCREFEDLKSRFQIKGAFKGISNVWALFDLDEESRNICEGTIPLADIERAYSAMTENLPLTSDDSIWVYLLRYERHSFYPKDVRGYFMDAIHVVCEYLNQGKAPTSVAEQTNVGQEILNLDSGTDFKTVLESIKGTSFDEQSTQISRCSFVTVAPLFLFLKGAYAQDSEKAFSKSYIKHCKEIGEEETAIAAYLLGATLGHDKTYDAYYDNLPLTIFKPRVKECLPLPTPVPKHEPEPQAPTLFPSEDTIQDSMHILAIMYKGKQTDFDNLTPAYSETEIKEMVGNGYKQIKRPKNTEVKDYIFNKYGFTFRK